MVTWTAARSYGHGEGRGYSAGTEKRREGNGAGAHGGLDGVVGELGTHWRRWGREDDLRRPELRTTAMEALQGVPACVAQRRGSARGGGALGHDGGARGWRGARGSERRRPARSGVAGESGREAQERGSEAWRGRGVVQATEASREGRAGRQLPWRACARRAATTRHVPLARGGGRLALASQLGWPAGPGQAAQCRAAGKLPFPISFSFLIF